MQEVVGFGNQLHVAVFDAVVHHLDVMPRAARPHVGYAGFPRADTWVRPHFGGYRLENGFDQFPGCGLAAGHDGRAPERALLAAADTGSDVDNPGGLELL